MTKANLEKEEMTWITIPKQQESIVARTLLSRFEEFIEGLFWAIDKKQIKQEILCIHKLSRLSLNDTSLSTRPHPLFKEGHKVGNYYYSAQGYQGHLI